MVGWLQELEDSTMSVVYMTCHAKTLKSGTSSCSIIPTNDIQCCTRDLSLIPISSIPSRAVFTWFVRAPDYGSDLLIER